MDAIENTQPSRTSSERGETVLGRNDGGSRHRRGGGRRAAVTKSATPPERPLAFAELIASAFPESHSRDRTGEAPFIPNGPQKRLEELQLRFLLDTAEVTSACCARVAEARRAAARRLQESLIFVAALAVRTATSPIEPPRPHSRRRVAPLGRRRDSKKESIKLITAVRARSRPDKSGRPVPPGRLDSSSKPHPLRREGAHS
jgi:hypothetical protein